MDVREFDALSSRVKVAKERKERAKKQMDQATREIEEARQQERQAYADWAKFVRDASGFGEPDLL